MPVLNEAASNATQTLTAAAVPDSAMVVYADCKVALGEAWRRGLPRDLRVRTLAPAILADTAIAAEPADDRLGPDDIVALESALIATVDDLLRALRTRDGPDDAGDIADVAARSLTLDFQGFLHAAAMVREADFVGGAAAVTASTSLPDLQRRFGYRVADILSCADALQLYEIPSERLPPIDEPAPLAPPLATRLLHSDLASLLWRLGTEFWDRLPFAGPRGSILVLRPNELLKETAVRFLRRGYALRSLRTPRPPADGLDAADARFVADHVEKAIRTHITGHVAPRALAAVAQIGSRGAVAAVGQFRRMLPAWRRELDRHPRPRAMFTNMLVTPGAAALYHELRRRGIPLIGFQHGVTPEISRRTRHYAINLENAWCDLSIGFNQRMTELCAGNPYGRGRSVAVGMPRVYRHLAGQRTRSATHPLWYVSTTLYHSNLARLHRGISDRAMFEREIGLINSVFAQLPHRVMYKPYPAIRYLDPDPVLERAATAANITVYSDRLDLRYVVGATRVLITSGATSTVSWCIMADRPTVFIDSPSYMTLADDAREAFGKAVFLFDESAPDFHDALRAFLSRPLGAMERDWAERAAARRALVERFFSAPTRDPAGRAADAIVQYLAKRAAP